MTKILTPSILEEGAEKLAESPQASKRNLQHAGMEQREVAQGKPKIGDKYGRLTITATLRLGRHIGVQCKCDCGGKKTTRFSCVKNGDAKSCGCFQKEGVAQRSKKHGHAKRGKVTQEWIAWRSAWNRCTNDTFGGWKHYGGRGISVCKRWKLFALFLKDMGLKPTVKHQLDRINNDGNYTPENCRWVTASVNLKNRRPYKRGRNKPKQ